MTESISNRKNTIVVRANATVFSTSGGSVVLSVFVVRYGRLSSQPELSCIPRDAFTVGATLRDKNARKKTAGATQ